MVSLDEADKNREFAESLQANFPLLSDPGKSVARSYGVLGFGGLYARRWTFFIDSEGIVRHIDKEVAPEEHGAAIADRLARLGVPRREP